ncbi:MAG: MFS transporter, partial [Chloroflexi bacterium]|nr:MFS transporter [Chloroflexota bacterium]
FLWLVLGRESQRTMSNNPEVVSDKARVPGSPPLSPGKVLRQKATFLLAFSLMGAFCLFTALASWLPTYYHQVFGMSLASASSVAAILTLVGIPACIVGGIVPMRLGLRKPLVVVSGLMVGLAGLGCFMVNNPVVVSVALAVYGIFGVIYTPSVFTIPMELPDMTPQTGSLVLALALAAGNLGSFMGPLIVGYLADLTGSYLPGFLICCLLSLSLLVGGLLLPETGPRAREKPEVAPVT